MVKRSLYRKLKNYNNKRKKRMKTKESIQKQLNQPITGIRTHHFYTRGYLHIKSDLPCQDTADSILDVNY